MSKIIGSKVNLSDENRNDVLEFLNIIADLICLDEVNSLKNYTQHLKTTRYQHSLNVAYYTFKVCTKFNLRTYEATRAALLHDLYFYDFKVDKGHGYHPKAHALAACDNAKSITYVSDIMEDAIVKHMWPLIISLPRHKESWVVQGADKYCACIELGYQTKNKVKRKVRNAHLMISLTSLLASTN